MKYGKGHPVDLMVSTDGNRAKLVVQDRGVGIVPEDQGRLFKRFERVRLDREATGYGVGLWNVRCVVEAYGGSATVESKRSEGASFIVQMPSPGHADAQPEHPRETDSEVRQPVFHWPAVIVGKFGLRGGTRYSGSPDPARRR